MKTLFQALRRREVAEWIATALLISAAVLLWIYVVDDRYKNATLLAFNLVSAIFVIWRNQHLRYRRKALDEAREQTRELLRVAQRDNDRAAAANREAARQLAEATQTAEHTARAAKLIEIAAANASADHSRAVNLNRATQELIESMSAKGRDAR